MADSNVNSNLLSAGLFDIAYSVDTARNDVNTIYWLFKFCAIALAEHGLDPYDVVPYAGDDSDDTKMMYTRADVITSHIQERNIIDQSSPRILSDEDVLARSIHSLLRLQLHDAEGGPVESALEAVEDGIKSAFRMNTHGKPLGRWKPS